LFAENPRVLTGPECWVAVYAFALQICGDFSGYSAIARGVARWMGFHLSPNFLFPYFSVAPSEFWSRWHISLSSWLRDYLYIPLGGNRGGVWKTCRNLLLTMLLGGLWHGAAWGFIAWGLVHGLLLIGYRLGEGRVWRRHGSPAELSLGLWRLPLALIFFHLICVTWLFFRADGIGQATVMLGRMFTDFQGSTLALFGISSIIFFGLPLMLLELWLFLRNDDLLPAKQHWTVRSLVYSHFALMLLTFAPSQHYEFIYFQF
jgi:D-alanyl-lipoteichoic acid acyltransferase DltB (MBOAT superfamily)